MRNDTLSHGRADTVAATLRPRLTSWSNLTIISLGTKEKLRMEMNDADRATNRSVKMKVIVDDNH